ncbi:MAG: hypothetical protein ACT4PM_09285 [Gemmatimonadales bacterium]
MRAPMEVRVTLLDTWEAHVFNVPPTIRVSELKQEALARSRVRRSPGEYEVKYNGARLDDEDRTLADAGVLDHAALIVLPLRRRPAR